MTTVSTKAEAKARGVTRYFTGKPCKRGHVVARRASTGVCLECHKESCRERYATPQGREQIQKSIRKYVASNPEKRRAIQRRRDGLPEPTRPTPERCECCDELPGKHGLHLDHCHHSGVFRGWLCLKCNIGIGAIGDTESDLENALDYLRKSRASAARERLAKVVML